MQFILNEQELRLYNLAKKHFKSCEKCFGEGIYVKRDFRIGAHPNPIRTKCKCDECGGLGYVIDPETIEAWERARK